MKRLFFSLFMLVTLSLGVGAQTLSVVFTNPKNNDTFLRFGSTDRVITFSWQGAGMGSFYTYELKIGPNTVYSGQNTSKDVSFAVGNYNATITLIKYNYLGQELGRTSDYISVFSVVQGVHLTLKNNFQHPGGSLGGGQMIVNGVTQTIPESGLQLEIVKGGIDLTAINNQIPSDNANYVFTSWSTGSTQLRVTPDIQIEPTTVTANFYSYPRTPVGVALSSSVGQNGPIKVSWTPNTDGVISYEVSRKVMSYPGVWEVVATTTNSYWIDPSYYYAPGGGQFTASYRVRAYMYNNSDYSNIASVQAEDAKIGNSSSAYENMGLAQETPLAYSIEQNYPNPFNPSTTISYAIPQDGPVSLKVYDVAGHEVASLVDGYKSAGQYNVKFDASKLSSGIYLYKIQAGTYSATKKMQLLK